MTSEARKLTVRIEPATIDHIPAILEHCRQLEREAYAKLGPEYLCKLITEGAEAWVGFVDDELVCMWTICKGGLIGNSASVWVTTARGMDTHPFIFARHSQLRLSELRQRYHYIYGLVLADNERSIRWLRWLGFTMGETELIGDTAVKRCSMVTDNERVAAIRSA